MASNSLDTFGKLAEQWERETRNMSSPNQIEKHPAYLEIIQMGPIVVPWILQRLSVYPAFWFKALSDITGLHPISPSLYGNVQAMADVWLKWGNEHGLIIWPENI